MNITYWILLFINFSLVMLAINSVVSDKRNDIIIFTLLEILLLFGAVAVIVYQILPLSSAISLIITIVGAGILFYCRKLTEQRYL